MSTIIQKGKKFLTNPLIRFGYLEALGLYNHLSDEAFLRKKWKLHFGTELNLDNPQTFNEKLQWLKLYDRKPEYTMMVDKYRARDYIAERIGEEYLIPLLGVWDTPEEIDFDALPNQFVLKCNHNSGLGMCICKDKSQLDLNEVKKDLKRGLREDFYLSTREWPYKDVPRKIICEKYMTDESGTELKDYKVFNFDGIPRIIEVDFGRFSAHKRNLYTTDWEYIDATINYPADPARKIDRPKSLQMMLEAAKKLSEGHPFLRTDFYSINERIYFGELTFYHDAGFGKTTPKVFEDKLSGWLQIPGGDC